MNQQNYFDRVREELAIYGANEVDIAHLLAVIIGKRTVAPETCQKLASKALPELASMSVEQLSEIVTERAAERIHAAFELGRRLFRSERQTRTIIKSPGDVMDFLEPELRFKKQEHFVVILLDAKNQVIFKKTVFIGSLNACLVHPREIFRLALLKSAAAIIVAHNHPSGDPTPSGEDVRVTDRLTEVGKQIGIDVLDHLIIGDGRYYSFKEQGRI